MLFIVSTTRTLYKASANIRMARYSKKFCKRIFCLSRFSLYLSKSGNHSTHLTSFHGIWFSPPLDTIVSYGCCSPHKILTPVSDGSNMVVSDKLVVDTTFDGSQNLAKFEENSRLVSSNTRMHPSEVGNNCRSDVASASPPSGMHKVELGDGIGGPSS